MRIHTLSSSFYRHFFSLSLSFLIFSRILTSHSVQYTVYTKTICTHTHTHSLYMYGSLGRLTRKVTPNYLSANCIEHLLVGYIYYYFFFYIYFYFIRFKNTAAAVCAYYIIMYYTQCDRIIIIYINVWFTVIYMYNIRRRAVLVPAVEGLLRARVAIVYNNIYIYMTCMYMKCAVIWYTGDSEFAYEFPKCDTV